MITSSPQATSPHLNSDSFRYPIFTSYGLDAFNAAVYNHFSDGPFFAALAQGTIDLDRVLGDYSMNLFRGAGTYEIRKGGQRWRRDHEQVLLKMDDGAFVFLDSSLSSIRAFASTREEASRWARMLSTKYRACTRKKPGGSFAVIGLGDSGPKTKSVNITRSFCLDADNLRLFYGEESATWEPQLIATMKARETGTLIFRGPPGTGKTTFIRHLIGKLRRTHRFYYLPVTQEELLTSPQMVEFWVDENRRHAGLTKVVILEDAEALLEDVGTGRKGAVANLLNISDGLLGELLKVQLLCTINCEVERLDAAIVRPGRLIGYREFPRLSPAHAQRIAAKHGLTIPTMPDYGLSDIFSTKLADGPKLVAQKRVIGFGAAII
jgi:hypothetical protein